MTFLPIVERELRVRARQKATFRTRVGAALAACFIIGFFLVSHVWRFSPAAMGKTVFWFVSGLSFLWCLLEGPRNTADALSGEKREGTLGLLFLTDLKSYDVVLGKLLATSLNSFYGILAVVPPLSIPLLLGGITAGEFWRAVLVLLVTLVFSLSASLFISANSRDERRAWLGAAVLVGFLAVIPPLIRWVPLPSTMVFGAISPTMGFYSLEDGRFDRDPRPFWYAVAGSHALSWGFLIAACLVLPRSWQDKPVQRANREVKFAARARTDAEPRLQMQLNPVVWMLTRGKGAEWYVWASIVCLGLPFIVLGLALDRSSSFLVAFAVAAITLNSLLAVWVAAKACFMMADARSSGALDLLVTTPLRPQQIIDGHVEALRRQFLPPFIVLTVVELLVVALLIDYWPDLMKGSTELAWAAVITTVTAAFFGAQLFSSAWFGLWCGLTTKKPATAVVKTVAWVFVVPIVAGACSCMGLIVLFIKDALLIAYASSQLRSQFRRFVAEGLPTKETLSPSPPRLPWHKRGL